MNTKKIIFLSFSSVLLVSLVLTFYYFHQLFNSFSPLRISPIWSPSNPSKPLIFPQIPPFSLDSIFSSDHNWLNTLPQDQVITLVTTGDVIPARSVNWKMTQYNDFTYPFAKTDDFLKTADLTLINLEAPLIPDCPVTNEGMVFCGDQRFIQGLKFADIDVANLANNHVGNWGPEGLVQTVDLLQKNGILASGFENTSTTKKIKGVRFGFLGFNLLDQFDKLDQLAESIQQAKAQVDFLIVSCHWGQEYQRFPAPETVALAHQLVDVGANLIIGNHPHWFQPIEIYKDKLIIYAHGNFIFDQEWSQETKTGIIGKYTIYRGKIIEAQFYPIFIQDYSQPFFLEGEEKEKVLKELKNISFNPPEFPESKQSD